MLHMSRATWRARLLVAAACLVCAAQGPVPFSASPEAARVTTIQGQVSVLHDSQPWALSMGDQVKLGQVILSGPDGYAAFLCDGVMRARYRDPNNHGKFNHTQISVIEPKSAPLW